MGPRTARWLEPPPSVVRLSLNRLQFAAVVQTLQARGVIFGWSNKRMGAIQFKYFGTVLSTILLVSYAEASSARNLTLYVKGYEIPQQNAQGSP